MSRIADALDAMRSRNALRLTIRQLRLAGKPVAVAILAELLAHEEQADRDILQRAKLRRNSGNRMQGRW